METPTIDRQAVVEMIISACDGTVTEQTMLGTDISDKHPVIIQAKAKFGVTLTRKELSRKRIGSIANTIVELWVKLPS